MSEQTRTAAQARTDAREAAEEWYEYEQANAGEEDKDDAAHEYAEWCSDVIFPDLSREVWASSDAVRDCEDEAADLYEPEHDLDKRIQLCVYCYVRAAFLWRVNELEGEDA
jgi:hypothetical protein